MNILDVVPSQVFPPHGGGSVRTSELMRRLSRSHFVRQYAQKRRKDAAAEVWITSSYIEYRDLESLPAALTYFFRNLVSIEPLNPIFSGWRLRWMRPRQLEEWLAWADVVIVEFPWQFGWCRRRARQKPVVLSAHNFEKATHASHARYTGAETAPWWSPRKWKNRAWRAEIERLERQAVREADLILAVSDADARALAQEYGVEQKRVVAVPNGVDTERIRPAGPEEKIRKRRELGLPERPTVIFVASQPNTPHRAGLAWMRKVAAAARDFNFLVVGGVCNEASREGNWITTGRVGDPLPCLHAADFSICPIEYGGGTKIKLLEALAAGLPTIAFLESLTGTGIRDREHVWCAPKDAAKIAALLRELRQNSARARSLSEAGRAFVCAHHDWGMIAEGMEKALRELAAGKRPPASSKGCVSD